MSKQKTRNVVGIKFAKCRACTMKDKRTKRNRTRSDQKRKAIKEYS